MNIVRVVIALALGALFIYSGALKVGKWDAFAMSIAQFLLLPPLWTKPAAFIISFLELSAGLLLFIPMTRRWGAALVVLLTAVFLFALISALLRGLPIDCGCFGPGGGTSNLWFAAWKDIALSLAAAFLIWRPRKN